MKTRGQGTIKSDGLEDNITKKDYSVLRSSERQSKGIDHVCERLSKALGMDKNQFRKIFDEIFTEMQIRESRYHIDMENDLPQVKLAMKKMIEPQIKEMILKLKMKVNNFEVLNETLDNLFHWYMNEYLADR